MEVRLHTFIAENLEDILQKWENFVRDVRPGERPSINELRDHAKKILHSITNDMQTDQSEAERHEKSLGRGQPSGSSDLIDLSSKRHAEGRLDSGFDLRTLVAEYRALRASVLHLWSRASPSTVSATRLEDMTRFNECVDQLLAESVSNYTAASDRSREMFLDILGHDLRTPLCAVTTAAALLEEKSDLSDPTRRLAALIGSSARAMKGMVNDLLDFAGSRRGAKILLAKETMDLAQLGGEVIEESRERHSSRTFEIDIDGDARGEWDPQRLRQLITNLLANAVQHGAASSPIRLTITGKQNEVEFGVSNQGEPIPPAARARIFDPLHRQSGDELSRQSGSLGLGLYLARAITIAHDGEIHVSSDETETVFTVRLPRTDATIA